MPKKPAQLSINLLSTRQFSFGEKLLNWSLTFGRYIIIGTEIIVLVVFLSRFKLDRDRIDLRDDIKERQQILSTQKLIEQSVTRLQLRLSEVKRIEGSQGGAMFALPALASLTPTVIQYRSILAAGDKLTIVGSTLDTANISQFVSQLKESPLFEKDTVFLEKIERNQQNQNLQFIITAIVKREKR